jgi:hypothetical protein
LVLVAGFQTIKIKRMENFEIIPYKSLLRLKTFGKYSNATEKAQNANAAPADGPQGHEFDAQPEWNVHICFNKYPTWIATAACAAVVRWSGEDKPAHRERAHKERRRNTYSH